MRRATIGPRLVTRKKSTLSDVAAPSVAQKRGAPHHSNSRDKSVFSDTARKSTFSDVAALGNAQNRCAPRYSHRPDKSVFSDTAAFSDAQINRTLLRAQETQALRGVAASRGAQKRDAHSPCKPTLSDVATFKSTQISSSPSHAIEDRAQKPAPSKFINGTVRSGSATETPPDAEIRFTE